MINKSLNHVCCCPCHGSTVTHTVTVCSCGRPIVPPPNCTPQRPKCPPAPKRVHPGTVEVPQAETPPVFVTGEGATGKPTGGAAQTIWFQHQVKQILRNAPGFGPRKDEFLPYLLVRNAAADRGKRPFTGVFWESPDIYVVPNQEADTAPLMPANLGGITQANVPTTLYAHVWNLGKSPVYRARVEFYWFNPSLGISRADANFIGAAYIDLSDRFSSSPEWTAVKAPYGSWISRGNHAIVRCPVTWTPTYQNNGHECLVVRAFEPLMDAVDPDQFSASSDRHVCQRNISVVQAASPAMLDLAIDLGYPDAPDDIEVDVTLDAPNTMDWLQLYARSRTPGFSAPAAPVIAGFLPPSTPATRIPTLALIPPEARARLLRPRERFNRGCCPLQIAFHASVEELRSRQAQVLRLRQRRGTEVLGGYTVVLLKP